MARFPLADVAIAARVREDKGDIAALAASMKRYGQIEPIIVRLEDSRLVCGERRVLAARSLGWTEIDADVREGVSDDAARDLEYEENLNRKDLTPLELSKRIVAQAQKTAPAIEQRRVSSRSEETPKRRGGGRPASYEAPKADVAAAIGVSAGTLFNAEQHVAAVEAFPELEPLPQSTAIETARVLTALPEPERETARATLQQAAPDARRTIAREAAKAEAEESARILGIVGDPDGRLARAALRTAYSKATLAVSRALLGLDPEEAAAVLDDGGRIGAREFIRNTRAWLDRLEAAIAPTLRLVQGGPE